MEVRALPERTWASSLASLRTLQTLLSTEITEITLSAADADVSSNLPNNPNTQRDDKLFNPEPVSLERQGGWDWSGPDSPDSPDNPDERRKRCNIDRKPGISKTEFLEEYVYKNMPVIIPGGVPRHWPALEVRPHTYTLSFLSSRLLLGLLGLVRCPIRAILGSLHTRVTE